MKELDGLIVSENLEDRVLECIGTLRDIALCHLGSSIDSSNIGGGFEWTGFTPGEIYVYRERDGLHRKLAGRPDLVEPLRYEIINQNRCLAYQPGFKNRAIYLPDAESISVVDDGREILAFGLERSYRGSVITPDSKVLDEIVLLTELIDVLYACQGNRAVPVFPGKSESAKAINRRRVSAIKGEFVRYDNLIDLYFGNELMFQRLRRREIVWKFLSWLFPK